MLEEAPAGPGGRVVPAAGMIANVAAIIAAIRSHVASPSDPRWTPKSGQYDQLDILAGFGCPPRELNDTHWFEK